MIEIFIFDLTVCKKTNKQTNKQKKQKLLQNNYARNGTKNVQ